MSTLSVTIICKNEQHNLARLLAQVNFADEIVVVDTGSDDDTVAVARSYTDNVYSFKWCDDFSKARNYAISKAHGDYIMWLDADDIVPQATSQAVRSLMRSPRADFIYLRYTMDGDMPLRFWRERIVLNCTKCRFRGFIHEAIVPFGTTMQLDAEVVHRPSATHQTRNLRIYRAAIANRRRFTLRDKFYYARTLCECGIVQEALPLLQHVAHASRAYSAYRTDSCKLLAQHYLDANDRIRARAILSLALKLAPPDSETCCLFAQSYFDSSDYASAADWYRLALCCGQQGTSSAYFAEYLPRVQLSVCLWRLGDKAGAAKYHFAARRLFPRDPILLANDRWFSGV